MPEQPGEPPINEGDAIPMPPVTEPPTTLPEDVPPDQAPTQPHVTDYDKQSQKAERGSTLIIPSGNQGIRAEGSMSNIRVAERVRKNLSVAANPSHPDDARAQALAQAKLVNEQAKQMGEPDTLPVEPPTEE